MIDINIKRKKKERKKGEKKERKKESLEIKKINR